MSFFLRKMKLLKIKQFPNYGSEKVIPSGPLPFRNSNPFTRPLNAVKHFWCVDKPGVQKGKFS
jgi:hypothetical protein